MAYESLLGKNRIEAHSFTHRDFQDYIAAATGKLADAGVEGLSDDTRFTLAYDAVRAAAEAVMAAEGYRLKSGEGQHAAVFAFLAEAEAGRWEEEARQFDDARKKRNVSQYRRFGLITQTEADELLRAAQVFIAEVEDWLIGRVHLA